MTSFRVRRVATDASEWWPHDPSRQQNDHCWIFFDGRERWIIGKRGDLLATTCEDGLAIVNFACVDWETYNFVALEMLRAAFPDCSLTYANSLAALAPVETLDDGDSR